MLHRTHRPRRAVAAVEFAITLPVLLVLVYGIWEIGRLVELIHVVHNSAREGARYAATGRRSTAQVRQAVYNYLANSGMKCTDSSGNPLTGVSVEAWNDTQHAGDPTNGGDDITVQDQMDKLNVRVTVPFSHFRWLNVARYAKNLTMQSTAGWNSMVDVPLTVDATIPQSPSF